MKDSTFEKYKRVIDEWLHNGENGTKAYQKYYPKSSIDTAKVEFSKILTFPNVVNYLSEQRQIISSNIKQGHGVTLESQILDQLAKKELYAMLVKMALKDKLDPLEEDKYKRLKDIVKLADVNKADDMLNKMIGTYERHNEQKKPKEKGIEELIARKKMLDGLWEEEDK